MVSNPILNNYGAPLEQGSYKVTSEPGQRKAPKAGASTSHKGTDIATPIGTKVLASKEGVITKAAYLGSAGNAVKIKHPDGSTTNYYHNSQLYVKEGQIVQGGQPIALSGNSGNSTGPHLHFEVEEGGQKVNSLEALKKSGTVK